MTDSVNLIWDGLGRPPAAHQLQGDPGHHGGRQTLPTEGSFNEEQDVPNDAHLMAEGVVATRGTLQSGDFTYSGDIGNTFTLNDSSGSPPAPVPATRSATSLHRRDPERIGRPHPRLLKQPGRDHHQQLRDRQRTSITDGQGGFDGVSRADADTVTEVLCRLATGGVPVE